MSNYPPGVTGNEPEIAGYEEFTFDPTSECTGEVSVQVMFVDGGTDERLVYCGYAGEVDAWREGATVFWNCPRCGASREEEMEDPRA